MRLVLENIKELIQIEDCSVKFKSGKKMSVLPSLKNAYLVMRDGLIEGFGPMNELNREKLDNDVLMEIDCSGRLVFPAYCDSHTHLVFPDHRIREFVDRIRGLSYEEISARGGGILNSAKMMASCSPDELHAAAMSRLQEIAMMGTGAVEIKSGYGLSVESELKILRVISRLKQDSHMVIKSTFLGAHAIPENFAGDRQKYIELIVHEMIPQIAAEELADYIDVFCDQGFFTPLETEQILMAGLKFGLRPKIHANEMALSGGVQVGVKYNALSVDHLEYMGDDEIQVLKGTETMPTVLPGAAFFLDLPLSPVRSMIESGLPVALASDYNPGSSPSGNMNFIQSLGCIRYKMTPAEAINAVTLNSAYAMGVEGICGSICQGKLGNVFITKELPGYEAIPYYFGSDLIETVILDGKII
ncbi:imidazolonepropionase [Gaoshiqia sp. Z1-71]|uniref:imidazolonepropionase n=1 Tax=Gaoshiqia hydrogeniformans TaxID=3290090 RepID=UPI003BF7CA33